MNFADGENVDLNVGSVGRPDNAVGPNDLSAGGPMSTPCDYKGRSADLSLSGGKTVTGDGPVDGPND